MKTLSWKSQIQKYLNENSKIERFTLIANDNYLNIIADETEHIIKWSEFKKVEINKDYINLETDTNYLIPKKSMEDSEFIKLVEIIRDKMK